MKQKTYFGWNFSYGRWNNQGILPPSTRSATTPPPTFVLIDQDNNKTFVETTYYSDGYTEPEDLFELTKITIDHQKWVNTAIVFQVDVDQQPNLAFRFINSEGNPEFYDIEE